MDGVIFYWLFWFYWILVTFFMNKQDKRLKISAWLLIAITLSLHSIKWLGLEISLTSLFILFSTYVYMARQKRLKAAYLMLTSFLLMLAFTSFHLFELYDPVWLIFNRNWMLAVILTYLTMIIHESTPMRIATLLFGSIHGDIIYALILKKFPFEHPVGSLMFLDAIAISIAFIAIASGFKRVSAYFENYFNHLEREKPRSS